MILGTQKMDILKTNQGPFSSQQMALWRGSQLSLDQEKSGFCLHKLSFCVSFLKVQNPPKKNMIFGQDTTWHG